ncbi:MAG: formamidopyrimidine-DNA glycosylase [Planctomyces sp.]|nr:formamidopyrimidine-DNA glycosylase [Planctomyces sp.]
MPELPEVETMVRGVRPSMEGRNLVELRIIDRGYRPLTMLPSSTEVCRRVAGARIARVWRLGKRVVLDFADRGTLAIEPRMTGLMLTSDPPSVEHLRLEFLLRDASSPSAADPFSVWFWDRRGLGTITWRAAGEIDELIRQRKLGPDALTLDAPQWQAALGITSRAVKVALLDQKLVAGVGNLYASEILHLAGISPLLAASKLTQAQWERLAEAAREVLELAILHEGSTLSDGTYRNALNKAGGYQNSHRVYAKAGEACQTCREGLIERIVQAQRSTFYCGSCQALKVKRWRKT